MRIVVCDDEKGMLDFLAEKLKVLCPADEIISYASGEEMLKDILKEACEPDILFLDIQMPGKNGIEAAREFRRKNEKAVLIFITALEEYVFQAFDVGAFHYLVKPFSDEKFEEVLHRAKRQYLAWEERIKESTDIVKNKMTEKSSPTEKSFLVKNGRVRTKVLLSHIIYAEVFNRKIVLHTIDGTLEYYGKMSELAKWAGEDFFRPHRAYLVHFKYVVKYDASTIWLENGTAIMAKKQYAEFVKRYLQYVCREKGE